MQITSSFLERWLFRSVAPAVSPVLWRQILITIGMTAALLAGLFVNRQLIHRFPDAWMLSMVVLALVMVRLRHPAYASPALQLWKWLGALSALYGLLHYPLFPALATQAAHWRYAILIGLWLCSLGCGIGCFRVPSLALVPPAYLVWSKLITEDITGLRHGQTLDVAPLPEVSVCIALGLLIVALYRHRARADNAQREEHAGIDPVIEFSRIVVMLAICIHLANYFWSFVAKATLHGPFLSWVRFNNPLNIYLAASDDGHITFSNSVMASQTVANLLDWTHIPSNIFVFFAQMIAVLGFAIPKRGLILLLIAFDCMHVAIAVAAGANFWPWVFLNLVIAAVVARKDFPHPRPLMGLCAAGFIVISPLLANVALLGWYDTGANNNARFLVETNSGERIPVSPNFFTFYSFPIAHMKYGMPDPDTAFIVSSPNGGTRDMWVVKAAGRCDAKALIVPGKVQPLAEPDFSRFIVNYHRMALWVRHSLGRFPYDFYPHHFYALPSSARRFEDLDPRDIRAYIYRRESVCLSYVDGQIRRKLVSAGELRIDVPQEK